MEQDARAWAVHRHVIDATPEQLGLDEVEVPDPWPMDLWELFAGDAATGLLPAELT